MINKLFNAVTSLTAKKAEAHAGCTWVGCYGCSCRWGICLGNKAKYRCRVYDSSCQCWSTYYTWSGCNYVGNCAG